MVCTFDLFFSSANKLYVDESQSHVKMSASSSLRSGAGDGDDWMMRKDGDDDDHDVVGGGTVEGKACSWLLFE